MDKQISDERLSDEQLKEYANLHWGTILRTSDIANVIKMAHECFNNRKRIKEYEGLLEEIKAWISALTPRQVQLEVMSGKDSRLVMCRKITALQSENVTNDTKVTNFQSKEGD